ncbi:MAG: hypothetical protein B7Y02_04255 [Rhodobacterales bacterium 17-64-5]|nr:MAG: hypothetical protein B7Y02_04255 [Rhodobacterales bacterium 17-64-5]
MRRLEDEQAAFEAFLERLRSSKDKAEFDTFMDERARTSKARDAAEGDGASEDDTTAKPVKDRRPGEY